MSIKGIFTIGVVGLYFIFMVLSASAKAQTSFPVTNKNWTLAFLQELSARNDLSKYAVSNQLFDFTQPNEPFYNDYTTNPLFPVSVGRDVYPNFDLMNTSTVVDRVSVFFVVPLVGDGVALGVQAGNLIPFPFANLSFGASTRLEIKDVHQVGAKEVDALPLPTPTSQEDDITELNPYLKQSSLKIADLVKFPFKLPLSSSTVRRMSDGEIMSYNISGQVGFSGSLGFKVLPTQVVSVGASGFFDTYLIGDFEVAVMKESDHFAKVRISRMKGRINDAGVDAGARFSNLINGIFTSHNDASIFGTNSGESLSIIPFQLKFASENEQEFSLAYRYDLDTEAGKDAFHRAVLGSFIKSDEVATQEENVANPSVTKLFARASLIKIGEQSVSLNFSLLLSLKHSHQHERLVTEVTLPNEASDQILENDDETQDQVHVLAHAFKHSRKFKILIDRDGFVQHKAGSVMLTCENTIENSKTHGDDLNQYTQKIQDVLHEKTLFPNFPDAAPNPHPRGHGRIAYGPSSFYFGHALSEVGLLRFLGSDLNQLSTAASHAGAKLSRTDFINAKNAYENTDPLAFFSALSKLFSSHSHIEKFSDFLFTTVGEDASEKFLFAQSSAFGSYMSRGHRLAPMELTLQQSDLGVHPDAGSFVQNLRAEASGPRQVTLRFNLSATPDFLYFYVSSFQANLNRDAVELIVYNRNQRFKQGDNTLVIDSTSPDALSQKLGSKLRASERVNFTMGMREAGANWGSGASVRFMTPASYDSMMF